MASRRSWFFTPLLTNRMGGRIVLHLSHSAAIAPRDEGVTAYFVKQDTSNIIRKAHFRLKSTEKVNREFMMPEECDDISGEKAQ